MSEKDTSHIRVAFDDYEALRQQAEAMAEALTEAKLQIEYLHRKFQATGTGNAVLARIDTALAAYRVQGEGEGV